MQDFTELTELGQRRRLWQLARTALPNWPRTLRELRFVQHGENTTFRVAFEPAGETPAPGYVPDGYALRIHGSNYNSPAAIHSELEWLAALSRDTDLVVPAPLPTATGALMTTVAVPGVPEPRVCSLLRWMEGVRRFRRPQPRHLAACGRLLAHLHNHARAWQPPADWTRRRWDWSGLLGPTSTYGPLPTAQVWELIPAAVRPGMQAVSERFAQLPELLGSGGDVAGLIHADLHLWNVLFVGSEARPIDFDDCGWGYWLYDLAVVLADWRLDPAWEEMHAAVLAGYASVNPFPADQLAYLDMVILARKTSGLLWIIGSAVDDPSFNRYIEREVAHVQRILTALPLQP